MRLNSCQYASIWINVRASSGRCMFLPDSRIAAMELGRAAGAAPVHRCLCARLGELALERVVDVVCPAVAAGEHVLADVLAVPVRPLVAPGARELCLWTRYERRQNAMLIAYALQSRRRFT